jgi:hypothetical protein
MRHKGFLSLNHLVRGQVNGYLSAGNSLVTFILRDGFVIYKLRNYVKCTNSLDRYEEEVLIGKGYVRFAVLPLGIKLK